MKWPGLCTIFLLNRVGQHNFLFKKRNQTRGKNQTIFIYFLYCRFLTVFLLSLGRWRTPLPITHTLRKPFCEVCHNTYQNIRGYVYVWSHDWTPCYLQRAFFESHVYVNCPRTLQEYKGEDVTELLTTTPARLVILMTNTRKWRTQCMDTGEGGGVTYLICFSKPSQKL